MDDDVAADNLEEAIEDDWRLLATAFVDDILLLKDEDAQAQRVREIARAEPGPSLSFSLMPPGPPRALTPTERSLSRGSRSSRPRRWTLGPG
jgi:hypothetical protein